ncbi:lantibiotic dehydratase [Streptomyces sp. NPDC102441]|uniref:lantibiotic dehydratase n=1 Tax=Streptomyces sp. NPDC102441 TaxID=3366176 RepID=UPI003805146D
MSNKSLYEHTGTALLRAAAAPRNQLPGWWPDPAGSDECMKWLDHVWSSQDVTGPIRQANRELALSIDAMRDGRAVTSKKVRRAALSTARYLLRATGRPTPFGLFAGVAPAALGPTAEVRWGSSHRAVARIDTLWLSSIIERLENCQELLERLDVVLNNLAARRGGRLQVPHGGPHGASIKYTSAVRALETCASTPTRFSAVLEGLSEAFPGAGPAQIRSTLTGLVRQGFLVTSLRAPLTVTDPLGHLIERLQAVEAHAIEAVAPILHGLEGVAAALDHHNRTPGAGQTRMREALVRELRAMSDAGRAPLAVDLLLDAAVQVPLGVVHEMEAAAGALLRLTRRPTGHAIWHDFQTAFWERYGVGTLVPLSEVLDPAAGLGLPAEYPGSVMSAPAKLTSERDRRLLALAWQALVDGSREIVLTDDVIDAIAGDGPAAGPPHVEMCARIHAEDVAALERGDFTLTVTPARSAGTLTSRFTPAAGGSGLEKVYRTIPPGVAGALPAQLSFPPLYPHTENVCRIPAYLPHVISLGEHRGPEEDVTTIPLDDLALTATHSRLHLVSISRRRIIEPQVFHAMALEKQPPPLARFLAHLPRAFTASWTGFDWGPEAVRLAYLPRVRYRRTVLSPARWRLTSADLPATETEALARWRLRWHCPEAVELRDDDRTLRLDLSEPLHVAILRAHLDRNDEAILTEAAPVGAFGWIGDHAHEVAVPLVATGTPAPSPLSGRLPTLLNSSLGHMPGSPDASWLHAKIHTHPEQMNEIITGHLPQLLAALPDETEWWFLRYRSPHESPHLRLRLRVPSAGQYATFAAAVGQWATQLRKGSLAGRLVLETYSPEIGRYGQGETLAAAEAVFAADSRAVAGTLRHVHGPLLRPTALVAVGMVDIARGFLGHEAGMEWLADRSAAPATADRAVSEQAVRLARLRTPLDLPGWNGEVTEAWQDRTTALARYRRQLPDDTSPDDTSLDAILESLFHMHHNRMLGLDRPGERICRRVARQAARAWQAHR